MEAKQLSRRTRLRRALERWENEGGSVVVKPDQTLRGNQNGGINTIRTKRAYEPPGPKDGKRFLVDALWPRGVKQDALCIEGWKKESARAKNCGSGSGMIPRSGVSFSSDISPNYEIGRKTGVRCWKLLEGARSRWCLARKIRNTTMLWH